MKAIRYSIQQEDYIEDIDTCAATYIDSDNPFSKPDPLALGMIPCVTSYSHHAVPQYILK
jgi:hypothetical protein